MGCRRGSHAEGWLLGRGLALFSNGLFLSAMAKLSHIARVTFAGGSLSGLSALCLVFVIVPFNFVKPSFKSIFPSDVTLLLFW